jgi:uncharacterized delta-60 repeat protein
VTFPLVAVHYDSHRMLGLQPDGALVAAGTSGGDFVAVRVLVDGTLDPAFGVDGVATVDAGGEDTAYTVLLQPDGGILVGGATDGDFAVARLLSDGTADPSFGAGGVATADVSGGDDHAYGLALEGSDVVAVGCGDCSFDYLYDAGWAMSRFAADGTLDLTFGTGGVVYDPIPAGVLGGTGNNDRAYSVATTGGGSILVVGVGGWNDSYGRMLAARYLPDGSLDVCFDDDGYYTQDVYDVLSQSDEAHEVLFDEEGRFTVVGGVNPSAWGYQGLFRALP